MLPAYHILSPYFAKYLSTHHTTPLSRALHSRNSRLGWWSTTHESYIARPVKTSFLGKGLASGITALGTRAAASSSRATCAADSLNVRGRMLEPTCLMFRAPGQG